MKSLVVVMLSSVCIPFSATSQTFDVQNSLGLRMSVDTDDRNPALIIVVPDGPEGIRSSKILFPEHVTVRAHGQKEQEHLYIFRAGAQGYSPKWKKTDNALEYAHDFGQIHFVARATLKDDGIVFHYEFTNHSGIDYDIVTAITDPRFHGEPCSHPQRCHLPGLRRRFQRWIHCGRRSARCPTKRQDGLHAARSDLRANRSGDEEIHRRQS